MIVVRAEHLAAIVAHGEQDYPSECCGLLIGSSGPQGRKVVVETLPMENAIAPGARHDRTLIPPKELLRGEKYARSKRLDVIGNYHSHPDWPAEPSAFDLEHAWPTWSYIIASIREGKGTDVLSWELEPDRSRFNPEELLRED